jgi:hypothetical protein
VAAIEAAPPAVLETDRATAYAVRVYSGQSADLPPGERIARVIAALEGQRMDIPAELTTNPYDAASYIEANS